MLTARQRLWIREMVEQIAREGVPAGHAPLVLVTGRPINAATTRIGVAVNQHLDFTYDSLRALVAEALESWIARHAAGELPDWDQS